MAPHWPRNEKDRWRTLKAEQARSDQEINGGSDDIDPDRDRTNPILTYFIPGQFHEQLDLVKDDGRDQGPGKQKRGNRTGMETGGGGSVPCRLRNFRDSAAVG